VTRPGRLRRVPHNFVIANFRDAGEVTAMPAGMGIFNLVFFVFPIVPAGWWLPFVIASEKLASVANFIDGKHCRYACFVE
jgi:hypothetical protein